MSKPHGSASTALKAYVGLLSERGVLAPLALGSLMLLAALTEGLGLLLLVPLLGLMMAKPDPGGEWIGTLRDVLAALNIPASIEGLLGVFVLLITLRTILVLARDVLGQRMQFSIADELREQAFAAMLRAEWSVVHGRRNADVSSMLITDISRVGHGIQVLLQLAAGAAVMVIYSLLALGISPAMVGIAALTGGVLFVFLGRHRQAALQLGKQLSEANHAVHENVQESLAGLKTAKILGNEQQQLNAFGKVVADLRQRMTRFAVSAGLARSMLALGGALLTVAYLYVGLRLLRIPVPELLTLVFVLARLMPRWAQIQQDLISLLHTAPALLETRELLAQLRDNREPDPTAPLAMHGHCPDIELRGLGYRYPDRGEAALEDISLQLPCRTTTAIMGPSGSGKSTLADLLMGLLIPARGEIRVGKITLGGPERIAWRKRVAYVPQDTFLFADSIRNNLLLAAPSATEVTLRSALEKAAAAFVFDLPQGLETHVGELGDKLSGGERQRIALARALLSRPDLLILDEATSALDVDNEERVRQAIDALHGDVTLVVISHRLSALHNADQVVLLEQGRIAACGAWNDIREKLPQNAGA